MGEVICASCKKGFQVPAYREKTARYCSRSCMGEGYSRRGAFHIPETKRCTHLCEHCGQGFERQEARRRHGRGIYCSQECQYAAAKLKPKKRVTFTCLGCQTDFELYPSQVTQKKGAGKYCSRKCRDEHRTGENHPQYINGTPADYGPHWQAQKRKAKRRDRWICRDCGATHQTCMARHGQGLQVHHVRPFRLFATDLEANVLTNLRTLCPPCHRKAEALFQRLEREVLMVRGASTHALSP